jgi:hypothetical protein
MPKSLRLGSQLEKALDEYCAETGETASGVIRESVAEYLVRRRRKGRPASAWDLGKDLFGADTGPARSSSTSRHVKRLIREKLRAKHHR